MVLLRARVFARGGSHGEFRPRSRAGLLRDARGGDLRRDPLKNCHPPWVTRAGLSF